MRASSYLVGALALATVASQAAIAEPAQFANGIVQAVSSDRRLVTLDSGSYAVRTPWELDNVTPGDKVDVAYVTRDGQRVAIAVTLRP